MLLYEFIKSSLLSCEFFFLFWKTKMFLLFSPVSRVMYSDKITNSLQSSILIRSIGNVLIYVYRWIYAVPKFCLLEFRKILKFWDLKSSNKITKFWFRRDSNNSDFERILRFKQFWFRKGFKVQTVLISKGFSGLNNSNFERIPE